MGLLTSQQVTAYYERFKSIDVTFTREIIRVTGLNTNQVCIKCQSDVWPCVIFSSSLERVKIVANVKSGILRKLEQAGQAASLRFCFKRPELGSPVVFYVNVNFTACSAYSSSADTGLLSFKFAQRPPDDFIEIMGRVLDANSSASRRRDERITINPDTVRRLGLMTREIAVFIEGTPRRCILRDISFSGVKIIIMGVAKFLTGKTMAMRIDFNNPRESFFLPGNFVRDEAVEGRSDLVALAVQFDETAIPMGYKLRINNFLTQARAAGGGRGTNV